MAEERCILEQNIHTRMVHSVPFITAFINMKITDTVLIGRHCWGLAGFSLMYTAVNWYTVVFKRDGKPIYFFITWEHYPTSICTALAITGTFCTLFYATVCVDEWVTGRTSRKIKGAKTTKTQ